MKVAGFEQDHALAANPAVLRPALEFLLDRSEIMDFGDGIQRHEADIVPVQRILGSGIA